MTHLSHSERVLSMKIFLIILILIFNLQSLTKANDIFEFEIEGVSIGESLLNFASKETVISAISNQQYPNDKYIIFELDKIVKTKNYEYLGATTKKNDKDYIVTSISGIINYKELNECLNLKSQIQKFIENVLNYNDKEEVEYVSQDGESKIYGVQYYLKPYPSNEAILINCYHFYDHADRQRNLSVSANSESFAKFLINEAYK